MLALGKNDFWGWPGILLWHSAFEHFMPGTVAIKLAGPVGAVGSVAAAGAFSASQRTRDGRLAGSYRTSLGYEVHVDDLAVVPSKNVVVAGLRVTCPPAHGGGGVGGSANAVELNVSLLEGPLGAVNIYNLTVTKGAEVPSPASPAPSSLHVTKANAPRHTLPPLVVPCAEHQIIYNSLRTFEVDTDGSVYAVNRTGGAKLCLHLGDDNRTVTTTTCDGEPRTRWRMLGDDRRSGAAIASAVDHGICLQATFTNDTACPHANLDPASKPPCRSMAWAVHAVRSSECQHARRGTAAPRAGGGSASASTRWRHAPGTGFLSVVSSVSHGCLGAVPPLLSNTAAVVARLASTTAAPLQTKALPDPPQGGKALLLRLGCNDTVQLTVGVATERDARARQGTAAPPTSAPGGRRAEHSASAGAGSAASAALKCAMDSADVVPGPGAVALRSETARWWSEWWGKSSVDLGPSFKVLQDWYTTMMYLLRGATGDDKVAPALWGPWSVSDAPDWGDEMTLDYNFEANYWSAATANHPEIIHSYAATVNSLLPLSRQRAELADWSLGGWPDMYAVAPPTPRSLAPHLAHLALRCSCLAVLLWMNWASSFLACA